ncbi:hypothetical protein DFJ73DRAFT_557834 [Zopfochytrium polystomum]|nr:hypothetical protein DFJ73DRAFT_557834 [Zopfochytrium polystomum]
MTPSTDFQRLNLNHVFTPLTSPALRPRHPSEMMSLPPSGSKSIARRDSRRAAHSSTSSPYSVPVRSSKSKTSTPIFRPVTSGIVTSSPHTRPSPSSSGSASSQSQDERTSLSPDPPTPGTPVPLHSTSFTKSSPRLGPTPAFAVPRPKGSHLQDSLLMPSPSLNPVSVISEPDSIALAEGRAIVSSIFSASPTLGSQPDRIISDLGQIASPSFGRLTATPHAFPPLADDLAFLDAPDTFSTLSPEADGPTATKPPDRPFSGGITPLAGTAVDASLAPATPSLLMSMKKSELAAMLAADSATAKNARKSDETGDVDGSSKSSESRAGTKQVPLLPKITPGKVPSLTDSNSVTSSPSLSGVSPALLPQGSKPHLTGGSIMDAAMRLATKSNYQNMLEGDAEMLGLDVDPAITMGFQQKKSTHKQAEQKRRDLMKNCFDDLKAILPPLSEKNPSKVYLLKKSHDFIEELKEKEDRSLELIRQLQSEIDALKSRRQRKL